MEIGLAVSSIRNLTELKSISVLDQASLLKYLGETGASSLLSADSTATHIYFGSEYCEHLFPEKDELISVLSTAKRLGLKLVLSTPISSDTLLQKIAETVGVLPENTEIVVNDWGVAELLKTQYPKYSILAGRQLVKMIKEPRVSDPRWAQVYQSSYRAEAYASLLSRYGVKQVELDVPPFATSEMFSLHGLDVSIWAPYAYIAKGRICKIGSLGHIVESKFAPGVTCRRECLAYYEQRVKPETSGLRIIKRGTALLYKYDASLMRVVREACSQGNIKRLVLTKD